MKTDRRPGYADPWIVIAMVIAELVIIGIIATVYQQHDQTQSRWDALFWSTSVGFPVVMVMTETIVNLAKRPQPFQWGSIAASAVFLALCGAVNALLTYHEIHI